MIGIINTKILDTTKIRAAWLDQSQIPDEKSVEDVIKIMKENGINRVYVSSWKNGHTFYNSTTLYNAIGEIGILRPLLQWTVKYAHPVNIEVYAWFEYGYIASYSNLTTPFGQFALKKGWIMGSVNNMYYMDPSTKATEFLANIMIDAIPEGVDGLQLDDHFSCRKKFPQCSTNVLKDAGFRLSNLIRVKNKTIPISLAPAPLPEAITEYSCNWPELFYAGSFDEIVPLLYSKDKHYFSKMLDYNEKYLKDELKKTLLIGIEVNSDSGELVKWEDAKAMIKETNEHKYGAVIWYGKAVVKDYQKEFHELWGQ